MQHYVLFDRARLTPMLWFSYRELKIMLRTLWMVVVFDPRSVDATENTVFSTFDMDQLGKKKDARNLGKMSAAAGKNGRDSSLLNPRAFLHHFLLNDCTTILEPGKGYQTHELSTDRKFVLCNVDVALAKHGELFFMWSETVVHTTASWELPWGMPSTLFALFVIFIFNFEMSIGFKWSRQQQNRRNFQK